MSYYCINYAYYLKLYNTLLFDYHNTEKSTLLRNTGLAGDRLKEPKVFDIY